MNTVLGILNWWFANNVILLRHLFYVIPHQ